MSKLLIYIGEKKPFDVDQAIFVISSLDGISCVSRGSFIGSVFECQYSYRERTTVIRLSENLETVTADGLGIDSLEFAVQFQKRMPMPLHAIDMEYSFDVVLSEFESGDELLNAISD